MSEQKDSSSERKTKMLEIFDNTQNLVDRLFYLTKWLTNVGLALLGFYIALLLQLKVNGSNISSYATLIPLVSLLLSILIGLYLKFVNELIEITQEYVMLKEDFLASFRVSEEDYQKIKESNEKFNNIIGAKLEHFPAYWIGIQFLLFLLSIVGIAIYLFNVLFI